MTRPSGEDEFEEVTTTGEESMTREAKPPSPPLPITVFAKNRTYLGGVVERQRFWYDGPEYGVAQHRLKAWEDMIKIFRSIHGHSDDKKYSVMATAKIELENMVKNGEPISKARFQDTIKRAWQSEGISTCIPGLIFFTELGGSSQDAGRN